jgi:hypothetical protein
VSAAGLVLDGHGVPLRLPVLAVRSGCCSCHPVSGGCFAGLAASCGCLSLDVRRSLGAGVLHGLRGLPAVGADTGLDVCRSLRCSLRSWPSVVCLESVAGEFVVHQCHGLPVSRTHAVHWVRSTESRVTSQPLIGFIVLRSVLSFSASGVGVGVKEFAVWAWWVVLFGSSGVSLVLQPLWLVFGLAWLSGSCLCCCLGAGCGKEGTVNTV